MQLYEVMYINGGVFDNRPKVYASSASQAVLKAFGVKAKRSGDFTLDFMAINENGRKTYLKKEASPCHQPVIK